MRCQPGRRTLLFSLSDAPDSDLTAKLSPALRAARVKELCPSKAAVRALNLCGGVNPSNPPHRRWASPRRLAASKARFATVGARTHRDLIHRKRSPFSYKEKALTTLRVGSGCSSIERYQLHSPLFTLFSGKGGDRSAVVNCTPDPLRGALKKAPDKGRLTPLTERFGLSRTSSTTNVVPLPLEGKA